MNIHDKLKFYKHGYSKITDHASREIRHVRLSRDDAELLVKYYEKKNINYENYFNEWLGIKKESIDILLNLQKSKTFWKLNDWNKKIWDFYGWSNIRKKNIKRHSVDTIKKKLGFVSNSNFEKTLKNYITIGKGYP
jgi:hypothetical protein